MRKTLIIGLTAAALTLGGLGTAVASGKFGHGMDGMMGGHMLERISQKLDLTEEQQRQVDDMIAANVKDMRQNMRNMKDLRMELRKLDPTAADYQQKSTQLAADIASATEKMVLMRAEQRQDFNNILTDDQRTELATMKDKMEEKWAKHGKHRFGGHDGEGKGGKHCRT